MYYERATYYVLRTTYYVISVLLLRTMYVLRIRIVTYYVVQSIICGILALGALRAKNVFFQKTDHFSFKIDFSPSYIFLNLTGGETESWISLKFDLAWSSARSVKFKAGNLTGRTLKVTSENVKIMFFQIL